MDIHLLSCGMRRNVFGQPLWIKRLLTLVFGFFSWPRFNFFFKNEITGAEHFQGFPDRKVLIVSNHQTYFADVIFMFHVILSSLAGRPNNIRYPGFFFHRKDNIYFVAAEETMKSGFLPRIMRAGGAVTVKRTWRKDGAPAKRAVDPGDTNKVLTALQDGWVISFPQGTTSPWVPGRKGTAHLIKEAQPIVVPVVIDGFRRAFDKRGLINKKKGVVLRVRVKEPIQIDYQASIDDIMTQIMDSIEQSDDFLKVRETSEEEQP